MTEDQKRLIRDERHAVALNTLRWWQQAHDDRTKYHQAFGGGYCPFCQQTMDTIHDVMRPATSLTFAS